MVRRISLILILAIGMGLLITRIDTRPHWDDTGITVSLLFLASVICGFLIPKHPWLIALAVCFWIPLYNIISSGNFSTLVAILPGLAGAYTGFYARKYFERQGS